MIAATFIDNYQHKGLRKKLIESLRQKGITDESVLEAMENVPRHFFFDSTFLEHAYQDKAFPIGSGQTISQPYTVAFQTQLLQVKPGMRIMEVGTGSGYQASVLAEMGARVFSIERQKLLYEKLLNRKVPLNFKIRIYHGDGYEGLPDLAPFDRIIITAAAPSIPKKLLNQLDINGILVVPVGKPDMQTMTTVKKIDENNFETKTHGLFCFVPMLANKANDK